MLDSLPFELKAYLIHFLPFPSLLAVAGTSRDWRELTTPVLAAFWQRATATATFDCGRLKPVLVEMVLASYTPSSTQPHNSSSALPPAAGANVSSLSSSLTFEPAAAKILGPNHYQIRDWDSAYRLTHLSFSFGGGGGGGGGGTRQLHARHRCEIDVSDGEIPLAAKQPVLMGLGVEQQWLLVYELNTYNTGNADAHFRPWLLTGFTRNDIIKQSNMTRFFVPRNLRVSFAVLASAAVQQGNEICVLRRIKGEP
ncbi:hypothetical protein HDU89_005046 [Geranomyces variabilis]|nr:hypothetical protein HDU89_005046 [Geranomyces variabilis]